MTLFSSSIVWACARIPAGVKQAGLDGLGPRKLAKNHARCETRRSSRIAIGQAIFGLWRSHRCLHTSTVSPPDHFGAAEAPKSTVESRSLAQIQKIIDCGTHTVSCT